MKKNILFVIAVLFAMAFFSGTALASWSIEIDTDYTSGDDQATFDLNINVEETAIELGNYEFTFGYDDTELAFNSYTHNLPAGYMEFMGSALAENGELGNFMGYAFMGNATIDAGEYTLGSFTFDVTNAVSDGVTDFDFLYTDNMFAFFVDGVPYSTETEKLAVCVSNYTDVSPVPLPAGIWFLGSGIVGLACARRKKA